MGDLMSIIWRENNVTIYLGGTHMSIEISMSAGLDISVEQIRQAHGAELDAVARYRRVTNYLAAAQIYLKSNVLLPEPLKPEHIKHRPLGNWGPSPGSNRVYAPHTPLFL